MKRKVIRVGCCVGILGFLRSINTISDTRRCPEDHTLQIA
jgi:hypothetical protein